MVGPPSETRWGQQQPGGGWETDQEAMSRTAPTSFLLGDPLVGTCHGRPRDWDT